MTDSFQSYFFFFFAPMNSPNESSLRVNRELNDVERDRGNATFLNEIFSLAKTRPSLPPLFTEIEREREIQERSGTNEWLEGVRIATLH